MVKMQTSLIVLKRLVGHAMTTSSFTSAYHFQQGRGEKVPLWMAKRYPWVKSPGQYGGRW